MEVCVKAIGIDMGASYCKMAIFREGKVEIITDEKGCKKIPSYVAFLEKGKTLFGDQAKEQVNSAGPRS